MCKMLSMYMKVSSIYFSGRFHVGLMHGRLNAEEKESVMRRFAANEIQVLVATTVVEVGVNVPNARLW